jgi:antitoxin PrlF
MLGTATITGNGQITLPPGLAGNLAAAQITELVIYSDGESIILKPLKKPDPQEYKIFMKEAQQYAADLGMTEADIEEALRAVRAGE